MNNLMQQVQIAKTRIASARAIRDTAELAAKQAYERMTADDLQLLEDVLKKYKNLAFDLAFRNGIPDLDENDSHQHLVSESVEYDGILLQWKGRDGIISFTATWAMLAEAEAKQIVKNESKADVWTNESVQMVLNSYANEMLPLLDIIDKRAGGASGATEKLQELSEAIKFVAKKIKVDPN